MTRGPLVEMQSWPASSTAASWPAAEAASSRALMGRPHQAAFAASYWLPVMLIAPWITFYIPPWLPMMPSVLVAVPAAAVAPRIWWWGKCYRPFLTPWQEEIK